MNNYDKAKAAMAEVTAWSDQGFPGASFEDLVKMTSEEPEQNAEKARVRAGRNVELLLAGCWEIRDELNAAGVTEPEYRLALYKSRMGVKKGSAAFQLMEAPAKDRVNEAFARCESN